MTITFNTSAISRALGRAPVDQFTAVLALLELWALKPEYKDYSFYDLAIKFARLTELQILILQIVEKQEYYIFPTKFEILDAAINALNNASLINADIDGQGYWRLKSYKYKPKVIVETKDIPTPQPVAEGYSVLLRNYSNGIVVGHYFVTNQVVDKLKSLTELGVVKAKTVFLYETALSVSSWFDVLQPLRLEPPFVVLDQLVIDIRN